MPSSHADHADHAERAGLIASVATLDDPVRRAVYDFAATSRTAVTRDAAAEALGISRRVAAMHLDRLAEQGLLTVEYRRLNGRTGPGAGRPAKLYRRSPGEVAVSIPDRRYDLIGSVFVAAAADSMKSGTGIVEALDRSAYQAGHALGAEASGLLEALDAAGYQPRAADSAHATATATATEAELTLRNCPFHRLAQQHTALVCGVNLQLLRGCLAGAGSAASAYRAELDPAPDRCCVRLITTTDGA